MGGPYQLSGAKKCIPKLQPQCGGGGRSVELAFGLNIPLSLVWPWLRPFLPWASFSPSVKWDQWSQQHRGAIWIS